MHIGGCWAYSALNVLLKPDDSPSFAWIHCGSASLNGSSPDFLYASSSFQLIASKDPPFPFLLFRPMLST